MQSSFKTSVITGVVALAIIMGAVPAHPAQAQSTEAMQLQITALLAQIVQLQNQLNRGNPSDTCPYAWTRNLNVGSSGADVKRLQQFLNSSSDTQIAPSGVGSKGSETEYYGALTAAAVARFQTKYRNEVLTPLGLSAGTPFFGNSTRAKLNSLCTNISTPSVPSRPSAPNTPTTPTTRNGNEAVLTHFKTSSGEDTSLEEGQRNVEVMEVEFDIKDSDITITRVDVAFEHVLGAEDDPWKTFEEVSLYVDGDKVASKSVTNRNDWSEDQPFNGGYQVRLSGLSLEFDEDDDVRFSVGVTLADSIDGAEDGLSWNVLIPDNGIRLSDGSRATQNIGDDEQTVNIDITEEGVDDELSIKTSSEDPEATTLVLKSNANSNWITVFAFDLDTDDSTNDIEIRELPISLTVSAGNVSTYLRDVQVVIDGDTYDDVTITDGTTNTMVFEFDSNELVIDAGDRVPVAVQVKFKALAPANEGVTIFGTTDADGIEAEGADDLTAAQLSGAATGDEHTLRTFGVSGASQNVSVKKLGSNSQVGEFTIDMTIQAFEGDFHIAPVATSSTDASEGGVMFSIDGPVGYTGAVNAVLSSSARETDDGVFIIREGRTETITLTVTLDPDTAGQYRVGLNKVYFSGNEDGTTNVGTLNANPVSSYRSNYTFINN